MTRNNIYSIYIWIRINTHNYKYIILDYPNLKGDIHRLEHFTSLHEVLKEYMGEAYLPNAVELLGIYGRVSRKVFYVNMLKAILSI